jgi:hypothetical protein
VQLAQLVLPVRLVQLVPRVLQVQLARPVLPE